MPIHRFLQNGVYDPASVRILTTAFENACKVLGLRDRTDPLTELLAKKIIEAAQTGERDPARVEQLALDALRSSGSHIAAKEGPKNLAPVESDDSGPAPLH